MWFSGSGESTSIQKILEKANDHSLQNGTIFVGCDSQITRESCIYSTVICMHGADDQHGGYYFFKREKSETVRSAPFLQLSPVSNFSEMLLLPILFM